MDLSLTSWTRNAYEDDDVHTLNNRDRKQGGDVGVYVKELIKFIRKNVLNKVIR